MLAAVPPTTQNVITLAAIECFRISCSPPTAAGKARVEAPSSAQASSRLSSRLVLLCLRVA
jgi:hypothetical protein